MLATALLSALGKFRFIGSRPRAYSWARHCGGLRISLLDGENPAFPLYSQGRGLVPRSAAVWFLGALKSRFGTARKAEKVGCRECVPRSISESIPRKVSGSGFHPRSH